jgi:hypothetical protein
MPGVGDCELSATVQPAQRSSDPIDDGHRLAGDFPPVGIEGNGEHDAAARVYEVAARDVPAGAASLDNRLALGGPQ